MYIDIYIAEYHYTYSVGGTVKVLSWSLVMNSFYSHIYHSTYIVFVCSPFALDSHLIYVKFNFLTKLYTSSFTVFPRIYQSLPGSDQCGISSPCFCNPSYYLLFSVPE